MCSVVATVHIDIEGEVEGTRLAPCLVMLSSGRGSWRHLVQDGDEHWRIHAQVEHLVVRGHHMVPHWPALEASVEHRCWVGRRRWELTCLKNWLGLADSIHVSTPGELVLCVAGRVHGPSEAVQRGMERLHRESLRHAVAHVKLRLHMPWRLHHAPVQNQVEVLVGAPARLHAQLELTRLLVSVGNFVESLFFA